MIREKLEGLRQKDYQFEFSLGYRENLGLDCIKINDKWKVKISFIIKGWVFLQFICRLFVQYI